MCALDRAHLVGSKSERQTTDGNQSRASGSTRGTAGAGIRTLKMSFVFHYFDTKTFYDNL